MPLRVESRLLEHDPSVHQDLPHRSDEKRLRHPKVPSIVGAAAKLRCLRGAAEIAKLLERRLAGLAAGSSVPTLRPAKCLGSSFVRARKSTGSERRSYEEARRGPFG